MDHQPTPQSIKHIAMRIVEELPSNATWDDLIYKMEVCRAIDRGLHDIRNGRVVTHAEVRRRFGFGG